MVDMCDKERSLLSEEQLMADDTEEIVALPPDYVSIAGITVAASRYIHDLQSDHPSICVHDELNKSLA